MDENAQLRAELQRAREAAVQSEAVRAERDQLAALVRGYENGRIMRLLRKLHGLRA
jgi:hypothetical protein